MSNDEANRDFANQEGPDGNDRPGQPDPNRVSEGDCLSQADPGCVSQGDTRLQAGGDPMKPPSTGEDQPSTGRGDEPSGESYVSAVPIGADPTGVHGDDTTGTADQRRGGYGDPGLGENQGRIKPTMGQKIKGATDEVVGKMTGNPGKVERGQELRTGEYGTLPGHNRP